MGETITLPSRLREGAGEGLSKSLAPQSRQPLPHPLPQAGGEQK